MKLNSKVTGGLAWAGLVLILAVPSAEMLTKPSVLHTDSTAAADAAKADVDAVETASVTAPKPATRPAAKTGDVVDDYVASGKTLPSYISDAPGAAVAPEAPAIARVPAIEPSGTREPATAVRVIPRAGPSTGKVNADGTFAGIDSIETASVAPGQTTTAAPVPYPASKRPTARSLAAVKTQPLIINEDELARREVASQPLAPRGPQPIVTGDQLEEWDSGSLADYLERQGLISDSDQAMRVVEPGYDEDGFFLSDGPNNNRRLIGPAGDDWSLF